MTLSPRRRATLTALCRRMVPLPDAPDPEAGELAGAVAARIGTLDPHRAREVAALLSLVGSAAGGMLGAGVPRGFG
ncbi:MAG TPA: hypothetical protein VNP72_08330, partial [Longimicrobium sp.]|nr:hypothetical protein [Longimicrobium sp.]